MRIWDAATGAPVTVPLRHDRMVIAASLRNAHKYAHKQGSRRVASRRRLSRWGTQLRLHKLRPVSLLDTKSCVILRPFASVKMVGLVRFELTTSCTPCKRATRLRYSPNQRDGHKAPCPDRTQALFLPSAFCARKRETAGAANGIHTAATMLGEARCEGGRESGLLFVGVWIGGL